MENLKEVLIEDNLIRESKVSTEHDSSRYKYVLRVKGTSDKNRIIEFLYRNECDRFSYFIDEIGGEYVLCCIDELYQEIIHLGIIEKPKKHQRERFKLALLDSRFFKVEFIEPSKETIYFERDIYGNIKFYAEKQEFLTDSFEVIKSNYGLRILF